VQKLTAVDNTLLTTCVIVRGEFDLTIVSADQDFDRIKEVEDLTVEAWWQPKFD
jgi:hypothetical protein